MEISIATASLKILSTHVATARLINLLDNGIPVGGALTTSIDEIGRTGVGLLGNPHLVASPEAAAPDGRVAYDGAPMFTSSYRATGSAS